MKIIIDEGKCVGAGQCVLVAPDVFDQRDEDGVAVLLAEHTPDGERARVQEAARVCPAAAIVTDGR
ncbi:ferredoxin [Streptomyces sp. NPDC058534]|uniref:ferredoxin n=1 Tax=Streptomyces sp. NPDC058534 TaxID=3346541 RepID=UPI003663625D